VSITTISKFEKKSPHGMARFYLPRNSSEIGVEDGRGRRSFLVAVPYPRWSFNSKLGNGVISCYGASNPHGSSYPNQVLEIRENLVISTTD
jgi:hypothetical protein